MNLGRINLSNPVNRAHPLNRGLVSWWLPLENTDDGPTLRDIAGRNHGTLTNGPTWVSGLDGFKSLNFVPASSQWVSIPIAVITGYPFTLSCVARSTDITNQQFVFGFGGPAGAVYLSFAGQNVGDPVRIFQDGETRGVTTTGYTSGKWHLLTMVQSSSTSRAVYIDAGSKGTNTSDVPFFTPTQITKIGVSGNGSSFLQGDVLSAWAWNRALSDDEVRRHFTEAFQGHPDTLNRERRVTWFVPTIVYTLPLDPSSYALTGQDTSLEHDHLVNADTGSYALTGTPATLIYDSPLIKQKAQDVIRNKKKRNNIITKL